MQGNTAFAGTADAASPATVQQCAMPVEKYTDEQVRQFVIALEDPFDPREIKWRVTNTTSDRRRGQVIAYADPRAYTDRLNALFTVRGWTREYTVQVIQNFERKERGNGDGIISGKIVVTCRVTIDGMGSHSGLGEEWADNENAGTSAEAQAFKRACSCFGLGRYLYDLGGNWVDLDERKQPLSRPRLPDWALPKRKPAATGHQNGHNGTNGNGHLKSQALSVPALGELQTKVKSLCEQVGFGLARSVTKSIASMENPDEIQDAGMLSAVSMKLEDTLRGVERLRTATGVVGQTTFSQVCREMNLAGDCLDDIPDRPRHSGQAFGTDVLFAMQAHAETSLVDAIQRRTDVPQQIEISIEIEIADRQPALGGYCTSSRASGLFSLAMPSRLCNMWTSSACLASIHASIFVRIFENIMSMNVFKVLPLSWGLNS